MGYIWSQDGGYNGDKTLAELKQSLTGVARTFSESDIIVSKTDLKGRITYANKTFLDVAGYDLEELMGQPHSIIRHPDMPRAVFKLLWDTLAQEQEIFAYVINRCKNGDHYWVLAHVTPSYNAAGQVEGYHSSRRCPDEQVVKSIIEPLYADLLKIEKSYANRKEGMNAAVDALVNILQQKGMAYDQFILTL